MTDLPLTFSGLEARVYMEMSKCLPTYQMSKYFQFTNIYIVFIKFISC